MTINLETLFNLFFSFAAFATVFFIAHIRTVLQQRLAHFADAKTTTGTVISMTRKQNLGLPLIEYQYQDKTAQFTATVSAGSLKQGQTIEIQIASDGSARIAGSSSPFMLHVLSASMLVFFILGCTFTYDKFF
ncbi:MAG: hypothetical protein KAG28_01940 [Cocleimonas sp.]|nr:hypothetical protein [Cocleimonas sp.]